MAVIFHNIGVPMIFTALPTMLAALLPIILLEAFWLYETLNVSFWNALKSGAIANSVSTFIGIPLTWLLLVIFQHLTGGSYALNENTAFKQFLSVTWQSPWLMPVGQNGGWKIYTAGLVLLIPFFFASWFSEFWVTSYILTEVDPSKLISEERNANLLSYILLAIYLLVLLVRELRRLRKVMSNEFQDAMQERQVS